MNRRRIVAGLICIMVVAALMLFGTNQSAVDIDGVAYVSKESQPVLVEPEVSRSDEGSRQVVDPKSLSLVVIDERGRRPVPGAFVMPKVVEAVISTAIVPSTTDLRVADDSGELVFSEQWRGRVVTVWQSGFSPRDIKLDSLRNNVALTRSNELLVEVSGRTQCPYSISLHKDQMDAALIASVGREQEFAVLRRGDDGLPYVSSVRCVSGGASITVSGLSSGLHVCRIEPLRDGLLIDSDGEWYRKGVQIPSSPLRIGFSEALVAVVDTGGARYASWAVAIETHLTDRMIFPSIEGGLRARYPGCEVFVARKILLIEDELTGESRGALLKTFHDASGWRRNLVNVMPFSEAAIQRIPSIKDDSEGVQASNVTIRCLQPSGAFIPGIRLSLCGKTHPHLNMPDFFVSARSGETLRLPQGQYQVAVPDAISRRVFGDMTIEVRADDDNTPVDLLAHAPIWTFKPVAHDSKTGSRISGGNVVIKQPSSKFQVIRNIDDLSAMTCVATEPVVDMAINAFGYDVKRLEIRSGDVDGKGRIVVELTKSSGK